MKFEDFNRSGRTDSRWPLALQTISQRQCGGLYVLFFHCAHRLPLPLSAGMHRFAAFPPPPALCAFGDATLAYQSVTLFAKCIDRCMHTNQQLFRSPCWDACPLERLNLLALVLDLAPHALDFCAD